MREREKAEKERNVLNENERWHVLSLAFSYESGCMRGKTVQAEKQACVD